MVPFDSVTKTRHGTANQSFLVLAILDHVTVVVVQDVFQLATFLEPGITDAVLQYDVVRAVFPQNAMDFIGSATGVYLIDLNPVKFGKYRLL